MNRVKVLALLAALLAVAPAQELDPVETLVHTYGPFDLRPDSLQQVPPVMEMTFPDDLWLIRYQTEMQSVSGSPISREFQCHTFFGTSMPQHHTNDDVVGLFSDGYTQGISLPKGFGIFFKAGEKIIWNPMFNNRIPEQTPAAMRLTLNVIRAGNLKFPLTPLRTTFRTIRSPGDLYFVSPGRDVRETTFKLPFVGKIHVIGTHIHPYGVSIELIETTQGKTVWKATGARDQQGKLIAMPVYVDAEGYSVAAGDEFKLVATYDNPTTEKVDAMAGVFILYSTDPHTP